MSLARFDADAQPVKDLLTAAGTGYYIPLYQRPYRWTGENVARLIADIVDGIVRFQRTGRSSTFLGSIITVNDATTLEPRPNDRPESVRQVIDGQQRIATLLALCGELNRAISAAFSRLPTPEKTVLEPLVTRQTDQLEMTLLFRISDTDDSMLPRMIRGGHDKWGRDHFEYHSEIAQYLSSYDSTDKTAPTASVAFNEVTNMMTEAFSKERVFDNQIGPLDSTQWKYLFQAGRPTRLPDSPESTRLIGMLAFAAFTLGQVQVISVRAADEESAFAVFEPLNTTGEPLTAFETFVPLVIYSCGGQHRYAGSLTQKQVDRFRTLLTGQSAKEAVQRTKRALVAFALSDTGAGIGEQLHDQRIYLRRYVSLDEAEQTSFLDGLGDTANCLVDLWYNDDLLPNASDHTRAALKMLQESRHTIPQGLMIRGYKEFVHDDPQLLYRLVRTLTDFWLLWRLSRSSTANVDGYYRNLMTGQDLDGTVLGPYCRRPNDREMKLPYPDAVAEDLREILRTKGGIHDRETWIAKASELAHGSHGNKAVLRYALMGAYDDSIPDASVSMLKRGTDGSSPALTSYWQEARLTLEHIAPQSPLSGDSSFGNGVYREGRVHRLGNLTLVPRDENRILGNKPWPEKRRYFEVFAERDRGIRTQKIERLDLRPATVRLLSNRYVPFCVDLAARRSNKWTEKNIADRGRRLAELIWDRFAPSLDL